VGSKTLIQQNPPVLNWDAHYLYNGRKMVITVVIPFIIRTAEANELTV